MSPTLAALERQLEGAEELFAKLTMEEQFWAARQPFLESRGYVLRPRYHPDWVPSWKGKPRSEVFKAEDGYSLPHRVNVMDGKRAIDGKLVYFKRVPCDSEELKIATYFSSEKLRRDPRNHCVPILEVLEDPLDSNTRFMVMPFLRWVDDPPFEIVDDVLECIEQLLEGLVFMHDHHVAHRDCAYKNLMMDASSLFPAGHHPIVLSRLPDLSRSAYPLPRRTTSVRYYFTDFGLSTAFAGSDEARLVLGRWGLDKGVPELSDSVPYDPFKTDIWIIGNFVRTNLLQKYANVDFLEPMVIRMVQIVPASRSSAAEVLQEYRGLRRNVSWMSRFWRLKLRDDYRIVSGVLDLFFVVSSLKSYMAG